MPNTLFVRPHKVHQVEGALYEWALYDIAGEQLKYGARSSLEIIDQTLMQNGIENVELIALWPSSAAFVSEVSLPGGQARYLQQALPFAVEEQVAQDIEQIHICLGPKSKRGAYSVINIDHSLFESNFQSFNSEMADIPLAGVYLDAQCLPIAEDDLSLCLSSSSVIVRSLEGKMISLKPDNLIPYLDSVFLAPSEDEEARELSMKVWVAADYMEAAKMLLAQIEQYPHLSISVEQFGLSEFEFLCECYTRNKTTLTNLCQGDFVIARQSSGSWHRWRAVAALAGLGFLLQFGVFIGQGMYFEGQADSAGQSALTAYQKIVPNSKRTTLGKLPRIIKGKLNQQRQGGSSVDVGFLHLLGEAGYQFDRSKFKGQLQFKSINYNQQRAELVLEMQAQSFDQLESLKNAIVSAGLTAKISSAVQEKEYFRGRISVGGA